MIEDQTLEEQVEVLARLPKSSFDKDEMRGPFTQAEKDEASAAAREIEEALSSLAASEAGSQRHNGDGVSDEALLRLAMAHKVINTADERKQMLTYISNGAMVPEPTMHDVLLALARTNDAKRSTPVADNVSAPSQQQKTLAKRAKYRVASQMNSSCVARHVAHTISKKEEVPDDANRVIGFTTADLRQMKLISPEHDEGVPSAKANNEAVRKIVLSQRGKRIRIEKSKLFADPAEAPEIYDRKFHPTLEAGLTHLETVLTTLCKAYAKHQASRSVFFCFQFPSKHASWQPLLQFFRSHQAERAEWSADIEAATTLPPAALDKLLGLSAASSASAKPAPSVKLQVQLRTPYAMAGPTFRIVGEVDAAWDVFAVTSERYIVFCPVHGTPTTLWSLFCRIWQRLLGGGSSTTQ